LLVGIGVKFGVNGRNGAKKIGGVGEDGGGEKFVKFGERVLDSHTGCELVAVGSEALEEVGVRSKGEMRGGVLGTEADACVVGQDSSIRYEMG
jgi:hypothetical protein